MSSSKRACAKSASSISGCTSASRPARPESRALMPESSERVHIAALRAEEVPRVVELAQLIWRAPYPRIISTAQIGYMLAQRYNPEVVRAELGRDDVYWDVLYRGGMPAGFASYFLTGAPGEMKLDKLYVHPRY